MPNLSQQQAISTPLDQFDRLPEKPGVYLLKNSEGKPVYVGKASAVKARVLAHLRPRIDDAIGERLKEQIRSADYILTQSPIEALILENVLIKKHKPRYNIRLKDDKSYPYLEIRPNGDFPQVLFSRDIRRGSKVYGPFTDAAGLRAAYRFAIMSCCPGVDVFTR